MHQPRPYGRFSHEAELSDADAATVEVLARSLTNFKSVSNLDSLKRVAQLSDGRQAVAIDMGGTFRIIVLERYEEPEHETDGLAETNVPMLFSGVITKAQLRDGEGTGIKLTEQTRRRIAGYKDKSLPKKDVSLQRFVIEYDLRFSYFKPDNPGIFTFTQYIKLRPTWYSGAMAEVMQVVGGYGIQDMSELPDDPLERARMIVPEKYMKRIRTELSNTRLPGYTGFPDKKGHFKCEYQHTKGNAVAFDSTGAPWLLQISARGVYAMPLPVVPATATDAFKEFMEDVSDSEIEKLIERFGGMPTGESFPDSPQDFEAWRRAGVIIKVCDTADFYDHYAYYQASGWAFNSRGSEGFNTCWNEDKSGLKQGYSYKMQLKLVSAPDRGKLPLKWKFKDQKQADELNARLSKVYKAAGKNTARGAAIKYKIRRHTVAELLSMPDTIDYWDALEMEPIANHGGSVSRVGEGPIYWGLKMYPKSQGRLKFPELTGEGCESFVMTSQDYNGGLVKCDTVVFGCYVNDELQVIKYFIDERKFYREEQSTYEDIMIVGAWEKTVTTGSSGLMGNFYTSSFDDRDEAPEVSTHTSIVGKDLGYGNPAYHTPPVLFCVGSLGRSRYYYHEERIKSTAGFGLDTGVCVPVFSRDCIMYAYTESTSGTSDSFKTTMGGVPDPNSYELWCYDSIFHWMGQTGSGNLGEPRSKDGVPVYVDTHVYNPSEYNDFADSGNWFGLSSGSFIDVTGVCGPYTSRTSSTHHANGVIIGGEAPSFESQSESNQYPGKSSGRLSISYELPGSKEVHKNKPHTWYFGFSPEQEMYFYRDAIRITFGDAEYANINEEDDQKMRRKWGHTELATHKGAHHFIGVINE